MMELLKGSRKIGTQLGLLLAGSFFLLVLLLSIQQVQAAVPLMPLEQIRVGDRGVARTVIDGTRIEEFDVEILGIMKNKGTVGDLILVRTSGDVIDRAGGIAQGMSGSPVFIDGKLIGAIGYGWSLTDQRTAMVTPIQDMLKLFDPPPGKVKPAIKPPEEIEKKIDRKVDKKAEKTDKADRKAAKVEKTNKTDTKVAPVDKTDKTDSKADSKTDSKADKKADETAPDQQPAIPRSVLSTPLMAAGFGENALNFLQAKLKPLQLRPVAVGDPPPDIAYGSLQPGSAVGVQLIRGDVSLGALGTVTYVDGDRVLAFGHPFLRRGPTSFLMTNAYIFTTIRGIEQSFKLGTTAEAIGMIIQDRGAGVAGEMNRFPGIVPMRMKIRSEDQSVPKDMAVQIAQDEEILPILAAAALLNAVNKTMDRSGSGTARISFEISARDMPGETYKRENMFYSPENISQAVLAEFYEFVAFLASNPHNPVTIMDIQTDISVSPDRRTARILSAKPLQLSSKPGSVVDIEVKLKPYRDEPITRSVGFTVPKDQKAGKLTLTVRGGGFFSLAALLKKLGAEGEAAKPVRKPPKSFEEMLRDLGNRDRNNDIVAEIFGSGELAEDETGGEPQKLKLTLPGKEKAARAVSPAKPEKTAGTQPAASLLRPVKQDKKPKGVLTTDYIIEGDTEVTLEIVAEKN